MKIVEHLLVSIDRHPFRFLFIGMTAYVFIFTIFAVWKYDHFLYNALDLAIYTQVFESFRTGNFWHSSIQQTSYLGDHFEPFLLFLVPFYLLFPSPKTLLVLQAVFLALPAIPVYFLAQTVFQNTTVRGVTSWIAARRIALLAAALYLTHPLVHNVNLFEFHLLPFALVFLFSALVFYFQKKFIFFVVCLGFALLVREDVPLIVGMLGVLAALDRRRWHWIIAPMVLAFWWFCFALLMVSAYNVDQSYKFLTYYPWLFNNSFIQDLLLILQALFGSLESIGMVLGFLALFMFFPVLAPRYLLLIVPVYLQFSLTHEASTIIFFTHYSTLFLPGLFLAALFGAKQITEAFLHQPDDHQRIKNTLRTFLRPLVSDRGLLKVVVSSAFIGLFIFFSPLGPAAWTMFHSLTNPVSYPERFQKALLQEVIVNGPSVLPFSLLPAAAAQKDVSALFYVLWGTKQFSQFPYIPSQDVQTVVVDADDLLSFCYVSPEDNLCSESDDRLRSFFAGRRLSVESFADRFILLSTKKSDTKVYEVLPSLPDDPTVHPHNINDNTSVRLAAFSDPTLRQSTLTQSAMKFQTVEFSLFWKKQTIDEDMYGVEVTIDDGAGTVISRHIFPMALGIYPVSDWQIGSIVRTNYRVFVSDVVPATYDISVRLVDIQDGTVMVDGLRTIQAIPAPHFVGAKVRIGKIEAPQPEFKRSVRKD